jgi:hypothetical protein
MSPIEFALGVIFAALIASMGAGAFAIAFFGGPAIERKAELDNHPVRVPGYDITMNAEPPFDSTAHDVALAVDAVLKLSKPLAPNARKKLVDLRVTWLPADESLWSQGARRHVRHPEFGDARAGWISGRHVFVVYRNDDTVADTEFIHELLHRIRPEGPDPEHEDPRYWDPTGIEGAIRAALH